MKIIQFTNIFDNTFVYCIIFHLSRWFSWQNPLSFFEIINYDLDFLIPSFTALAKLQSIMLFPKSIRSFFKCT